MPEIRELELLEGPVLETDAILIQRGLNCYRLPGTAFAGDDGLSGSVVIGSVTTIPHGGTASVTNSGTPLHAVLDFELVEGKPGTDGETPAALSRQTATHTTATLEANATEQAGVTLSPSFEVLRVTADGPCRVRLYSSASARAADLARPVSTAPTPGTGLILEVVFTAAGSLDLSPPAHGASLDTTPSSDIPASITNTGTAAASLSLGILYLPKETQ